jgi:glutathionylspermidine synthase
MKRIDIFPRKDWDRKIESQGFLFYDLDNYYNETACYEFTAAEIDKLDIATAKIFDMCLAAANKVIDEGLWKKMFIPEKFAGLITKSWKEDACSIYGRFDLAFTDNGDIKLLEFNADTPTGLLEAAVIQWYWLQEYNKKHDQFNSIHEKLVSHFKVCKDFFYKEPLWFSCVGDHTEDYMTVKYLEDCASQAGIQTGFLYINEISVSAEGKFCTVDGQVIYNLFKLYPWEWMVHEEFSNELLLETNAAINWMEPPYKMIWSNKMLLVLLKEMFPDSPFLLDASFNQPLKGDYVRKPVYSREGANIQVVKNGIVQEQTEGDYGEEGFIYQEYVSLPDFKNNRPVIGSWVIGGVPAGMGIRESSSLITNNTSRFVPHYFI